MTDKWTDRWTFGNFQIYPCLLQGFGTLGPLPKKDEIRKKRIKRGKKNKLDGKQKSSENGKKETEMQSNIRNIGKLQFLGLSVGFTVSSLVCCNVFLSLPG